MSDSDEGEDRRALSPKGLEKSNLTTAQYLLWIGQSLHPNLPLYNMIHTFELRERIDLESFGRAFNLLLQSSDAMRTIIAVEEDIPQQRVLAFAGYALEKLDFSRESNPESTYRHWLGGRMERNHDSGVALFDSALVKMDDADYRWYLNQPFQGGPATH